MTAYYNEFDKFAAAWLRQLIEAGHIAPGIVDERSIEDVTPGDLAGFTQCHFFAGIGVWSYALRRAGWPDSRRVWTASCPCQPFSAAGQGVGFADERHLWPAFYHLASQCRPDAIYGEQVASKDAGPWIDLVHTDMEALGYAFGAVPFPSASIGTPHIRDRLYWMADAALADATCVQPKQFTGQRARPNEAQGGWAFGELTGHGDIGGLANSNNQHERPARHWSQGFIDTRGSGEIDSTSTTGPTNGFWRDSDWLGCRDGKFRPVEPGTFPLANGAPARVGRLRGYGNAINAIQAQIFVEATLTGPSI
jgi:DNA (cytosine-5)-methyltransferase 1